MKPAVDVIRSVEPASVLPTFFDNVKGLICQMEKIGIEQPIFRYGNSADGNAGREGQVITQKAGDSGKIIRVNAFCKMDQRLFSLHVAQEDDELITADSPAFIVLSQVFSQNPGKHEQNLVTGVMAEHIVYHFKGIQVQHAEQACFLGTKGTHFLFRRGFVQKAGQPVCFGIPGHALHLPLNFKDFMDTADQNVRLKRLSDIVHGARFETTAFLFLAVLSSQKNDGDFLTGLHFLFQEAHRFKAIHTGHVDIQQEEIRPAIAPDIIQDLFPGLQRRHPHPGFA